MAYIGVQPTDTYLSISSQQITGTGSATYTLDYSVSTEEDVAVFVNNVRQNVSTYTVSGTSLTLGGTISASDSCWVLFLGRTVGTKTPAVGSVTNDMLASGSFSNITGTGTLTNFTSTGIDDNADATAITIDSSENVGIGTTSPSQKLHIAGGNPVAIVESTTSSGAFLEFENTSSSNTNRLGYAVHDFVVDTNGSERMRIESNGRALFSTTGTNSVVNSAWKYQMRFDGGSDAGLYFSAEANANGTGYLGFHRSTNTEIGSVTRNGTNDSVNYNTSSDYRMKENVIDLSDATTRVKQLQPKRFSWISQESDTATQDGFIAHEVQSIVPEAITGTHNEVQVWKEGEELPEGVSVGDNKLDDEGNTIPKYQGIDQSKLVPLLTASLKEAIAKIEELETRIATLENA